MDQQSAIPVFYPAQLLKRYKRFLADVRLPDGSEITIHCPNTGSMKNCVLPDSPCWYSVSASKTRKYPQTLEVVRARPAGIWPVSIPRAPMNWWGMHCPWG